VHETTFEKMARDMKLNSAICELKNQPGGLQAIQAVSKLKGHNKNIEQEMLRSIAIVKVRKQEGYEIQSNSKEFRLFNKKKKNDFMNVDGVFDKIDDQMFIWDNCIQGCLQKL
jgi:hypothetical protein